MRKLLSILIFILLHFTQNLSAQSIAGIVEDADNQETLIGVSIIANNGIGTTTDSEGKYFLTLNPGLHILTFSYIGYASISQEITIKENTNTELNISLNLKTNELNVLVISGSLYEKKLSEETVSIEVIKSSLIENTNSVTLVDALTKVPGVYMLDEQANIRGGTGFTYGAGSRVMLIVDDQILLAADRGDAKWNFVPIENVQQVEVIKGASSVLYGSSALNGVITVRTLWPSEKPKTTISVYQGIYDQPKFSPATWWDFNPLTSGMSASHLRKINNMDLVLGSSIARDDSYLQGEHSYRARLNWKTRFHPKNNHLTYGINGNIMYDDEGIFFLWQDPDSNAYKPFGGDFDSSSTTLLNWKFIWTSIDPWIQIQDEKNNLHKIKMRFYNNHVVYSDTTGGNAWLMNFDYQFHRAFNYDVTFTSGVTGYYFHVEDDQLLDHKGFLAGAYAQLDKKIFERIQFNIGVREEVYQLDSLNGVAIPIFKTGINYQTGAFTNLRASFGQGYRVPSLVEKYAKTSLGALNIFPNPDIVAEYGWNAEIGIKKQIFIDGWNGFADAAVYVTDYFDMTEFTFNLYPTEGFGFKSINTTRARMGGIECTINGSGELFGNQFNFIGGYNYVYPANLTSDSTLGEWNTFLQNFAHGITHQDSAFLSTVLNYRIRHMMRFDAEYEINKFSIGTDVNYFSAMDNVDVIFVTFIPGLTDYLSKHEQGDWIFDARFGYSFTEKHKINFLIKNISNRMYALRPAKYDPPRSFTMQYKYAF